MDHLTFFREGSRRICSSLDIDEALQESLSFLKPFMPLNCINFSLFEPDIGAVRIVAQAAEFLVNHPLDTPIALSEEAQTFIKSHTGETIIIDSQNYSPPAKEISAAMGLRDLTGIGLTLRIKDEQVGVVGVLSNAGKPFTSEHARLLELLHDPFAIAMSNHLRYREVLRLKELLADNNKYLHKELHRLSGDEIVGGEFRLERCDGSGPASSSA